MEGLMFCLNPGLVMSRTWKGGGQSGEGRERDGREAG